MRSHKVNRNRSAGRLVARSMKILSTNCMNPFGSSHQPIEKRAQTSGISQRTTPIREYITLPYSKQIYIPTTKPATASLCSSRTVSILSKDSKDSLPLKSDAAFHHIRSKSDTTALSVRLFEPSYIPNPVPNLIHFNSSAQPKSSKCGGDYCHNSLIRVPPYDKQIRYYINSQYIKLGRLHRYSFSILTDLSIPCPGVLQQIREPTRFESFIQRSLGGSIAYKVLDTSKEPKKSRKVVGVCYRCIVVYYNIQQKYNI